MRDIQGLYKHVCKRCDKVYKSRYRYSDVCFKCDKRNIHLKNIGIRE